MKTLFLTTIVAVFLVLCTNGINAQATKSHLDQIKLMQQAIGTWQGDAGKDTVEVQETQQYGKAFITTVYLIIKGKKSPYYINNYSFDSKEGNFKGFVVWHDGDYSTWIGLFTTEKKLSVDIVQNFKPEAVNNKIEILYETPKKGTWTYFNKGGKKTGETTYNKTK
jgi:hypothetical protein